MGLFGRKKKELDDPVGVKCSCNNGVETITTYEIIRNPEPRPRFYPWMNNPGSEEYAQGGGSDAKAFRDYESSKTVASGSYTKPCSRCNGTGIRIVEWKEADKKGLTIVYRHPIFNEHGVMDLSKQRRDSDPQPETPATIQAAYLNRKMQGDDCFWRLSSDFISFYRHLSHLEEDAGILKARLTTTHRSMDLRFVNIIKALKELDYPENFTSTREKKMIDSINAASLEFFREIEKYRNSTNEPEMKVLEDLKIKLISILLLRSNEVGMYCGRRQIDGLSAYYFEQSGSQSKQNARDTSQALPNQAEINELNEIIKQFINYQRQITIENEKAMRDISNRFIKEIDRRTKKLVLKSLTREEKSEVDKINDKASYEFHYHTGHINSQSFGLPY